MQRDEDWTPGTRATIEDTGQQLVVTVPAALLPLGAVESDGSLAWAWMRRLAEGAGGGTAPWEKAEGGSCATYQLSSHDVGWQFRCQWAFKAVAYEGVSGFTATTATVVAAHPPSASATHQAARGRRSNKRAREEGGTE